MFSSLDRSAEALRHADQLLAAVIQRPVIGRLEGRQHLLEIGLHRGPVERLDQLFGPHHFAGPRIVHVDQVPHIDLARAQAVDHGRVVGQRFRLHCGAGGFAERVQHLGRVVAFPTENVQFLGAIRGGAADAKRTTGRDGRRHRRRLLHEVTARHSECVHCPISRSLRVTVRGQGPVVCARHASVFCAGIPAQRPPAGKRNQGFPAH